MSQVCRQSSLLYYFFCHLAEISIKCLSKTHATEINSKIYQIFATITKTLTPMVQSALPTICNITGMFECMADYLFEKKKYTKMTVIEILLVYFYYLHMDLFINNSFFIFYLVGFFLCRNLIPSYISFNYAFTSNIENPYNIRKNCAFSLI